VVPVRSVLVAFVVFGAAGIATLASHPARAQTLFQQIFGYGSPSQQQRPAPRLRVPQGVIFAAPGLAGFDRSYGRSPYADQSYRRYSDDELGYDNGGRTYQTMCVRMCDGYYWPISASATRGQFHVDAALCSSSCEGEARLFYRPNLGEDPQAMTDLSGRAYARLPNAFRYRKSLVAGCTCRPAPWSEAEIDRHRRYAWMANPPADWRGADIDAEAVAGDYGADASAPQAHDESAGADDNAADTDSGSNGEPPPMIERPPPTLGAGESILRPVPRRIFNVRSYPPRGWSPAGLSRYPWPGDARRRIRY